MDEGLSCARLFSQLVVSVSIVLHLAQTTLGTGLSAISTYNRYMDSKGSLGDSQSIRLERYQTGNWFVTSILSISTREEEIYGARDGDTLVSCCVPDAGLRPGPRSECSG